MQQIIIIHLAWQRAQRERDVGMVGYATVHATRS